MDVFHEIKSFKSFFWRNDNRDGPKLDCFLKYNGEQTKYKMCYFTMSSFSKSTKSKLTILLFIYFNPNSCVKYQIFHLILFNSVPLKVLHVYTMFPSSELIKTFKMLF